MQTPEIGLAHRERKSVPKNEHYREKREVLPLTQEISGAKLGRDAGFKTV
jgi:hypothetical protein